MPARGPPPGGDRNIGGRLVVLQSILISFATLLIALRLYVRSRIIRALGLDDFFIVLALVRKKTMETTSAANLHSYLVGFSSPSASLQLRVGREDMRTIYQKGNY